MDLFYLTRDINFQKALLIVATIALILAILVTAYRLNSSINNIAGQTWPPVVARCPDYWEFDSVGKQCINSTRQNIGDIKTTFISLIDIGNDKKKWAKTNKVVWDGLTSE
jgi:hypothetical protein